MQFILSAFADEAADGIGEQLEALQEAGITQLEIRGVCNKNISAITPTEARSLRFRLDEADIGVSALGSPYGKIKLVDDFAPHLDAFRRSLEVASILGTRYIRMFSFFPGCMEPTAARKMVLERLDAMLTVAQEETDGILCCHENEKSIYGDTVARCVDLMQTFSGRMGFVFDPANFLQCGEDAYFAWQALRPHITYYHIKDVVRATGVVVPAGGGDAHLVQILSELREVEGETFLTLEPHLQHFAGLAALEANAEESIQTQHSFKDNRESFAYAAAALKQVLADADVVYR